MKHPKEGELVLLRLRGRTMATDGHRSFMQPWSEGIIAATYHAKPYGSESAHFHGNFMVADIDCQHREVELLEWVGFSGRGKCP